MNITNELFLDFLKCERLAHLRLRGSTGNNSELSDFESALSRDYRVNASCHLREQYAAKGQTSVSSPPSFPITEKYDLITDLTLAYSDFVVQVDALTRDPTQTPLVYIPVMFAHSEKLSQHHKLLLAFWASALTSQQRTQPSFGTIVHGSRFKTARVTFERLLGEVNHIVREIRTLKCSGDAPRLFLNVNCPKCEFRDTCHETAVATDDLSLLQGIKEKEVVAFNNRGIFTIAQLSYTYRPRKRSRRSHSKNIKYYHSLKARAIRDKRTYVTGSPDSRMIGTPVYLDVEGTPDQDFYYLIGLRVPSATPHVHRSFWADERADERKMWHDCLQVIGALDNPQLLHYGSYETTFLRRMRKRYGQSTRDAVLIDSLIKNSRNVLSEIYGQIYFPTYSNGLKDVASFLDYKWSPNVRSGLHSLLRRHEWETTRRPIIKDYLVTYNAEDCEALETVVRAIAQMCGEGNEIATLRHLNATHADTLRADSSYNLGPVDFVLPELADVNKCAYWDYQRDRIYVRSYPGLKRVRTTERRKKRRSLRINAVVGATPRWECPECHSGRIAKYGRHTKLLNDLRFLSGGVKRWITKHIVEHYKCRNCDARFSSDKREWTRHRYGPEFLAYVIYNLIELHVPQLKVSRSVERLFGYSIGQPSINRLKARAADMYRETCDTLTQQLLSGSLIHADETQIRTKDFTGYVWAFTSMQEVVYVWSPTREAHVAKEFLAGFSGVLVTDFYSAYDSINCPQQKCLIHLIRDLNSDVLKAPFNEELKGVLRSFATLLKGIVETVDRFGLKGRFLGKHKRDVVRFYEDLGVREFETDVARKVQERLTKNRHQLFTFLDHDGVPWNNNNAEHAIKAFSHLREVIQGCTNERGIRDYLILLSIFQTCVYKGADFLDFLRSGERCVDEYVRKKSR